MRHPTTLSSAPTSSDLSPITATINLSSLAHNVTEIRRSVHPTCEILAIVKANAYGHGYATIAQALLDLGIQRFGVATVQEGSALRNQGITHPILVMGSLIPSQLPELLHYQLTPVLTNEELTYQLAELVEPHHAPYPVHIKIDTGMRRLGFSPDFVLTFLGTKPFEHTLQIEGLMTHLADADNLDQEFTNNQLEQFQCVTNQLRQAGHTHFIMHAANSAGIMYYPSSHFDMVRPGLMLYGCTTRKTLHTDVSLHSVMKVSTYVGHVRSVDQGEVLGYGGSYRTTRPSKIAIVPVGYAHGYSRNLSNRGIVLIQGQRVPIVGKICMDMMLIDVTDRPQVSLGEEVVLLGQQGKEEISAEEMADWLGTIPYEVLCSLGTRAHHIYESNQANE